MKLISVLISLLVLALSGFRATDRVDKTSESVVLVELFTSQGCLSCPAADQLLGEVISKSEKEGKSVLGLSFHVSYWNHLGWKDPYSSVQFTARQRKYAEILRLQSIYTPQMIVNGKYELVGSDRFALSESIDKARKEIPLYKIHAKAKTQGNEVVVHYALDKEPQGEIISVALIESSVENRVTRGENKDKILKHSNVVRKLEVVNVAQAGEVIITIPKKMDLRKGSIILYVQDPYSLNVLAAVKVGIDGTSGHAELARDVSTN